MPQVVQPQCGGRRGGQQIGLGVPHRGGWGGGVYDRNPVRPTPRAGWSLAPVLPRGRLQTFLDELFCDFRVGHGVYSTYNDPIDMLKMSNDSVGFSLPPKNASVFETQKCGVTTASSQQQVLTFSRRTRASRTDPWAKLSFTSLTSSPMSSGVSLGLDHVPLLLEKMKGLVEVLLQRSSGFGTTEVHK